MEVRAAEAQRRSAQASLDAAYAAGSAAPAGAGALAGAAARSGSPGQCRGDIRASSSASSGTGSGGSGTSTQTGTGSTSGAASSQGNTVTSGASAPAVMTVADLGGLQVRANVPELNVGSVASGQHADVAVNALPGQALPGIVVTVNQLPGSGSSVQYGTSVSLTQAPPGLRVGMSANVTITTQSVPNAAFLPSVAIRSSGAGATTGTVTVLAGPDQHTESRTVGLGLSSNTVTQITSGLAPTDRVVLPSATASPAGPGGGGAGAGGGGAGGAGGGVR